MTIEEAKKVFKEAKEENTEVLVMFHDHLIRSHSRGGYPTLIGSNIAVSAYRSYPLSDVKLEKGFSVGAQDVRFGSDPEFFFTKNGNVAPGIYSAVGLDRVAPDGFQAELHPHPHDCRQLAGDYIGRCLEEATGITNLNVDFSVAKVIDTKTFLSVPEDKRRFGCSPTVSVYGSKKPPVGTRTRLRSCGGHIHLGNSTLSSLKESDQHKLVKLLDIICGNTCVLVDRDENNIKRRKIYGRAGEYRMKPYGLEYRVPSNFWLNGYILWSMVSGLARNATNIFQHAPVLADTILNSIDIKLVREAINENDITKATKVFDQYIKIIEDYNVHLLGGIDVTNTRSARRFLLDSNALRKASCAIEEWTELDFTEENGFEEFLESEY